MSAGAGRDALDPADVVAAFPFDRPDVPISLYAYAPVFRVRDRRGDWVVKRTGLARSDGSSIGAWLTALRATDVAVVAPVPHLAPNPRRLADGREWVVYPFIDGSPYDGSEAQIVAAGHLLGRMHAAVVPAVGGLLTLDRPVVRDREWAAPHGDAACAAMRKCGLDPAVFERRLETRLAEAALIEDLPLAGCSADFKAANLVFGPQPTLVDPDHAARMPRLSDIATAVLLFHCDLPSAPARVWREHEWQTFLTAYRQEVRLTSLEVSAWPDVLRLAWLDEAVWLLGNWPEGWADPKERCYLADLACLDLDRFTLTDSVVQQPSA